MKVFIGIPSYSWTLSIPTVRSLVGDIIALAARGDTFTIYDEAGNTEISLARECIAKAFLESDADCLVFLDDDVCWQKGALLDLLDAPVDLVAGIYRKRTDAIEWPVRWLTGRKTLEAVDGLLEVEAVPTGFLRLSRICVEKMHEAYGNAMFDNIRHDAGRYSEDISFCMRWRDLGGKVWISPEMQMGHVGPKLFSGSIGAWLRSR